MGIDATQDTNQERRDILDEFFKRVWKDGSFVSWVNPKTHKLNVKEVANKILKTSDTSIFSKWAQHFRDEFNEKYRNWRQANGELTTCCYETVSNGLTLGDKAPDAFLEGFMKSSIVKDLNEFDEDSLMILLNSYQALSCERFLAKIKKLLERVNQLEKQCSQKDKKLALQAEIIEFIKTVKTAEESYYMGSIRNVYGYDIDLFDSENKV